ncbi:MAG: hypothetical protein DSY95_05880 [SAR324 cluster bacterium]|uniref:Uncharacterized protein n=1 Tax=SAR324 cluster bacterium TaxID=2024889 RepID=A0A432GN70_9DELT|nr:MAG: hypothetical protein DSY95_05880 [SAR324 cluster bacterium]
MFVLLLKCLKELIAAVYIIYPHYIDPDTEDLCEVERVLEVIEEQKYRYDSEKIYRFIIDSRNFLSRKIQLIIRIVLGE